MSRRTARGKVTLAALVGLLALGGGVALARFGPDGSTRVSTSQEPGPVTTSTIVAKVDPSVAQDAVGAADAVNRLTAAVKRTNENRAR